MKRARHCGAFCSCFAALLASAGAASASIVFSFADPGPGKDIFHFEGQAPPVATDVTQETQPGVIVSIEEKIFNFVIDASDDGMGVHVVPAMLWMFVNVGPLIDPLAPVLTAPANGGFAIIDPQTQAPYLVGAGDFFLTFSGTSGALFGSSKIRGSSFFYLAGSALKATLPLLDFLAPTFDGSFALADASIDNSLVNSSGFLKTFVSNVSFVGSAQASFVPTPGVTALLTLGGVCLLAHRRR